MALLGVPRVPSGFVSRPRLTGMLDARRPLTVLRGPAGSGKSMLVADWAAAQADAVRGIWMTVDETTAKRASFWQALLDALVEEAVLDMPVAQQISPRSNAPDALRRMLLKALSRLTDDVVVVVDSFEFVEDPEVAEDLVWVLRHCSALNVVVATRTLGPLESATTRAALDPALVLVDDLAMTPDEVEQLLAHSGEIERERAIELHAATGGLPLAVRIGMLALSTDPQSFAAARGEDFTLRLGQWLRGVIAADRRHPQLFDFAARTAVAPLLTLALAAELSGSVDAAELMDAAEQEGLGMWSTTRHGRAFVYTPLVRAAFLAEAEVSFAAERDRLWRTAAAWCARHGDGYTATRLALEIEDLDLASAYVREAWVEDAALTTTYLKRLRTMPRHRLRKHPLLLMVLALSYNTSAVHRLRALETFALAVIAMKTAGDSVPLAERVMLLGAETAAHRISGRLQKAVAAAEKTSALLDKLSVDDIDGLGDAYVITRVHVGITFLHTGAPLRALRAFEQAYAHGVGRRSRTVFHARALIAGTHALLGNMREAAETVDAIGDDGWPESWFLSYVGAFYSLAQALLCLERHDYGSAQAAVDTMTPHLPTLEHWPLFVYVQSVIDLSRGDAAARLTLIETDLVDRPRPAVGSYLQQWLDAARAQLLLATGRIARFDGLVKRRSGESSLPAAQRALRALLQDDPRSALSACSSILDGGDPDPRVRVLLLSVAVAAAIRLGRQDTATSLLTMTTALMRQNALGSALLLLPLSDREAMRELEGACTPPGTERVLADAGALPDVMRPVGAAVELSTRERVVLRKLAHTESAARIAEELFVSTNTVKSQLRTAYKKLGVNSREEALLAAAERGLLQDDRG